MTIDSSYFMNVAIVQATDSAIVVQIAINVLIRCRNKKYEINGAVKNNCISTDKYHVWPMHCKARKKSIDQKITPIEVNYYRKFDLRFHADCCNFECTKAMTTNICCIYRLKIQRLPAKSVHRQCISSSNYETAT